ncbi:MAG: hypothetical protein SOW66_02520 [Porphyromonas sp.]|nr:hypothetical protein [Porphyromonas sp.]
MARILITDTIYRRYLYIEWLYKRYITREANDQDKPKVPPHLSV